MNCKPTSSVEIIDLDDDNKTNTTRQARKKQKASCCNKRCGSDETATLQPASKFVAHHFGDREGAKGATQKLVCDACFELAVEHNERMYQALEEGEPLLALEVPPRDDPVFNLDSDEEEAAPIIPPASTPPIPMAATMLVSSIVSRVAAECRLSHQLAACEDHLDGRVERLEVAAAEVEAEFAAVQERLDALWEATYAPFRPLYESVGEIDIDDSDFANNINAASDDTAEARTLTSSTDDTDDEEIIFLDEVVTVDNDLPILVGSPISLDPSAPWDDLILQAPAAVPGRGPTPVDETVPASSTSYGPYAGCPAAAQESQSNGVAAALGVDTTNCDPLEVAPDGGDVDKLDAVRIESVISLAAPVVASDVAPVVAPDVVPDVAPVDAPDVAPVITGLPSPFDLLLTSGFPATSASGGKASGGKAKPVVGKKVVSEGTAESIKAEALKSDCWKPTIHLRWKDTTIKRSIIRKALKTLRPELIRML